MSLLVTPTVFQTAELVYNSLPPLGLTALHTPLSRFPISPGFKSSFRRLKAILRHRRSFHPPYRFHPTTPPQSIPPKMQEQFLRSKYWMTVLCDAPAFCPDPNFAHTCKGLPDQLPFQRLTSNICKIYKVGTIATSQRYHCKYHNCSQTFSHRSSRSRHHKKFHFNK